MAARIGTLALLLAASAFGQFTPPQPTGTGIVKVTNGVQGTLPCTNGVITGGSTGAPGCVTAQLPVYCAASGTNTLTCTGSPAPSAYATGMQVTIYTANENTGAVTLNLNNLGAVNLYLNGSALAAGNLLANNYYTATYDGTHFNLTNLTGQCVRTKYTIAYNDTALNVSSATPSKTLFTAASTSVRLCSLEISGTTSFTGITNLTAATVYLASNAGTPLQYTPAQDIFGTVGNTTNNYWSDILNTIDRTNLLTSAYFVFTCSSGNCYGSGLTAGSVDIVIGTYTRP